MIPKKNEPDLKSKVLAPLTYLEKETKRRVIIVLENCPLEVGKIRDEYKLLNSDDHYKFLLNNKKNPEEYRPDIVHQCLMTLLDSPLNKSGNLELYLKTTLNVLIQVNPQIRIPRTFTRFSGLMVQLLQQLKIRASDGNATLMKVIKNPITKYLPSGAKKIGFSHKSPEIVSLSTYLPSICKEDEPLVFVVGGFAHGKIDADYIEHWVSISNYPLSASVVLGKICCSCEDMWGIL
jgi:rRNA small subunit pseudouridine methyltransferase Nep1